MYMESVLGFAFIDDRAEVGHARLRTLFKDVHGLVHGSEVKRVHDFDHVFWRLDEPLAGLTRAGVLKNQAACVQTTPASSGRLEALVR